MKSDLINFSLCSPFRMNDILKLGFSASVNWIGGSRQLFFRVFLYIAELFHSIPGFYPKIFVAYLVYLLLIVITKNVSRHCCKESKINSIGN